MSVLRCSVLLVSCHALVAAGVMPARAANPDALWNVVGGQCDIDMRDHGDPAPCARVDLARGFAALKDISPSKPERFLLIPTTRIAGIESPDILAPNAPNVWQGAWEARTLVANKLGVELPRDAFALAINSAYGRTQNQLHIHVDCVRADVRDRLKRSDASIGAAWSVLPEPIDGHAYRAMRVMAADFQEVRPFNLLADGVEGARDHMGRQTLVAVGTTFPDGSPGFYLLTDTANLLAGDRAEGEALIDPACQVRN